MAHKDHEDLPPRVYEESCHRCGIICQYERNLLSETTKANPEIGFYPHVNKKGYYVYLTCQGNPYCHYEIVNWAIKAGMGQLTR